MNTFTQMVTAVTRLRWRHGRHEADEILERVAGTRDVNAIPRDRYADVVAACESAAPRWTARC